MSTLGKRTRKPSQPFEQGINPGEARLPKKRKQLSKSRRVSQSTLNRGSLTAPNQALKGLPTPPSTILQSRSQAVIYEGFDDEDSTK